MKRFIVLVLALLSTSVAQAMYYDRETGLHYNYFRDYDPGSGRYVEADPIGLEGSLNLYAYVGGNPISYVDPFGLKKVIFLPPDDPNRKAAENEPDDPAICLVISHGSAQSVNHMNASQLNKALFKAGCKPKQPVKLEACNTGKGENSIGEQLAKLRGAGVTAPDDRVWTTPWGGTMHTPYPPMSEDHDSFLNAVPNVAKPGSWRTFWP